MSDTIFALSFVAAVVPPLVAGAILAVSCQRKVKPMTSVIAVLVLLVMAGIANCS